MPVMKVWDSGTSSWLELGIGAIAYQTTAPLSPTTGQLWIDSDDTTANSLLVAESIVSGSAVTSVTFSGLDGNAAGGYVLTISWKGVSATGGRYITATINGDSTSGHYFGITTYITTSGVIPGASTTTGVYVAECGTYQPYSSSIVNIMTGHVPSFAVSTLATATSSFYSYYNLASYYQESNITSITLTCSPANEIAAGSTFRLYRRK